MLRSGPAATAAALLAGALGCAGRDELDLPPVDGGRAADRVVIDYVPGADFLPPEGEPVPPGGGSGVDRASPGGPEAPVEGPPPDLRDAAVPDLVDAASPEARSDAFSSGCDLLRQNCPGGQACYPSGSIGGPTECRLAGDLPEGSPCTAHSLCERAHVCGSIDGSEITRCARVCNTMNPACGLGVCRALTSYPPAGYCTN